MSKKICECGKECLNDWGFCEQCSEELEDRYQTERQIEKAEQLRDERKEL